MYFFVIFILGLLAGRWGYFIGLVYEGRRKISPYRCLRCHYFLGCLPWPVRSSHCSQCCRKLDVRCTIMEYTIAFSWVLLFAVLGRTGFALEAGLFCWMSAVACMVDIRRTILPDTFTIGGIGIALLGAFINPEREWSQSLTGFALGMGGLALFSYCYYFLRKKEGIGWGDIKMVGWIGALVGFQGLCYVLSLACLFGFFFWLISALRNSGSWVLHSQQEIAFGPYLAFSAYIFILLSNKNFGFNTLTMYYNYF